MVITSHREIQLIQKLHKPPKLSEKVEVGKNCKNQDNDKFCAGRQKKIIGNWRKITSDKFILDIVQQSHLEFDNDIKPSQLILPFQMF